MEKKHYLRFFTIADYEKEQKWLNDMSRIGWNFIHINGIIYTFEKGIPGEYVYKIDLPSEQMNDEEVVAYYKFMEECGIELVDKFKQWRYLRKKNVNGDIQLNDNTLSQLSMVNKAYNLANKITGTALVTFAVIIILSSILLPCLDGNVALFVEGFVMGISSSGVIALATVFVVIIRKLRLRMNELVDELQIKS